MPVLVDPRPCAKAALLGVLAAAVVLSGCGAADAQTSPSSPASSSSPQPAPDGATLRSLGLSHAPATITVPREATITRRIDQPNVVTVLFAGGDAKPVLAHLTKNLPGEGFTITHSGGDSLIFTAPGWEGAYTASADLSGLTLRRVGS